MTPCSLWCWRMFHPPSWPAIPNLSFTAHQLCPDTTATPKWTLMAVMVLRASGSPGAPGRVPRCHLLLQMARGWRLCCSIAWSIPRPRCACLLFMPKTLFDLQLVMYRYVCKHCDSHSVDCQLIPYCYRLSMHKRIDNLTCTISTMIGEWLSLLYSCCALTGSMGCWYRCPKTELAWMEVVAFKPINPVHALASKVSAENLSTVSSHTVLECRLSSASCAMLPSCPRSHPSSP